MKGSHSKSWFHLMLHYTLSYLNYTRFVFLASFQFGSSTLSFLVSASPISLKDLNFSFAPKPNLLLSTLSYSNLDPDFQFSELSSDQLFLSNASRLLREIYSSGLRRWYSLTCFYDLWWIHRLQPTQVSFGWGQKRSFGCLYWGNRSVSWAFRRCSCSFQSHSSHLEIGDFARLRIVCSIFEFRRLEYQRSFSL